MLLSSHPFLVVLFFAIGSCVTMRSTLILLDLIAAAAMASCEKNLQPQAMVNRSACHFLRLIRVQKPIYEVTQPHSCLFPIDPPYLVLLLAYWCWWVLWPSARRETAGRVRGRCACMLYVLYHLQQPVTYQRLTMASETFGLDHVLLWWNEA